MFDYVCRLESTLRYKDKDIDRLTYLNQYLTEGQKKRDEIILESQKEVQRLKQLLILYQKKVNEIPRKETRDGLTASFNNPNMDTDTTFHSRHDERKKPKIISK